MRRGCGYTYIGPVALRLQASAAGPAGRKTGGEEADTLEDVVEPFLLQTGFIRRTPKGRQLTAAAYSHLKIKPPPPKPAENTGDAAQLF